MSELLARKYEQFIDVTDDDRNALRTMSDGPVRTVPPRADIVREGDRPRSAMLMLDGWACLYKTLADGRRQTLAMVLPGDLVGVNATVLQVMDHSLGAITSVDYVEVASSAIEAVAARHPRIAGAFTWDTLVAAAVQREWALNLGQRNAAERMAHLICEMFVRLDAIGLARTDGFDCPLTQTDLAGATGMTSVHVNRVLQDLRARELIEWRGRAVLIPNWQDLCAAAMFQPDYLHRARVAADARA